MPATIKSSHVIPFGQVHMRQEHWSNAEKLVQQNWGNKTKKEEFELDEKVLKHNTVMRLNFLSHLNANL